MIILGLLPRMDTARGKILSFAIPSILTGTAELSWMGKSRKNFLLQNAIPPIIRTAAAHITLWRSVQGPVPPHRLSATLLHFWLLISEGT